MTAHVMVANEIAKAKFLMQAEFEQVIQARNFEISSERNKALNETTLRFGFPEKRKVAAI